MENQLKIGLAQISPVWLNKEVTISKMIQTIQKAQDKGCELLVFGEGLLPGYPFWLAYTHGTSFDDPVQKEIHDKNKVKMQQYQNEIDIREMEINRVKKILESRDADCQLLQTRLGIAEDRVEDLEQELELKSGENNRLRK